MSRNIRKHQKVWVVDVVFFFWQLTVGMAQMESRWYTMVTPLLRRSSSEMLWRPSTSMPLWRMSKSGSAGTRDAACCNLATKPRASLEATSPFLLPQFSPSFPVKHWTNNMGPATMLSCALFISYPVLSQDAASLKNILSKSDLKVSKPRLYSVHKV